MLNNNLYRIISFSNEGGKLEVGFELNTHHPIFEGHFPGQPVLPGVCMIQIFKELIEKASNKKLFLTDAGSCKFLSMVDPRQSPKLIYTIDYNLNEGNCKANGVLKNETAVFLKLNNCNFRVQP
jgi:3-hydroxyacyl-[acyl-carrier-protein] dehydratase